MTAEKTEKIERTPLSVPVYSDYTGPRMDRRVTIVKDCPYVFMVQLPIATPDNVMDLYGVDETDFRRAAVKELSYLRDKTAMAEVDTTIDWATVSEETLKEIGVKMTIGFKTAKIRAEKSLKNAIKERKVSESDQTKIKYGLSPDATMEELVEAIQAAALKAVKAVKK